MRDRWLGVIDRRRAVPESSQAVVEDRAGAMRAAPTTHVLSSYFLDRDRLRMQGRGDDTADSAPALTDAHNRGLARRSTSACPLRVVPLVSFIPPDLVVEPARDGIRPHAMQHRLGVRDAELGLEGPSRSRS